MRVLGIESTCDETAAAVVEDGRRVLSNVVASQADLHAVYGGVVPEIASRAHLENLLPVLDAADVRPDDLDAVAVANRPGLIGSLLTGLTAAKTLAWAWDLPLVGVDHVRAHLNSVLLDTDADVSFPAIGLVVSGGHTSMTLLRSWTDVTTVGRTIDDAVGEAYDKVASLLGLGYPGGPIVDRLAREGDSSSVTFPRPMLGRESLDFSFSGLKTSVLYHVRGKSGRERDASLLSPQQVRDVCAAFQAACVDTLVRKLSRAAERFDARAVVVGGGVSANHGLRQALPTLGLPVFVPKPAYCTDNAAMVAGYGAVLLGSGRRDGLDLEPATLAS